MSNTPQEDHGDPGQEVTVESLSPAQQVEMRALDLQAEQVAVQGERIALTWRLGIVLVTLFAMIGIFWLLTTNRIADVEYARGLITVLFSVGVVAIALILVLSLLLQKKDETAFDAEASEKKFQRSKEILALLLGILGTIVGFYFGTTSSRSFGPATVVEVMATADEPAPGEKVSLTVLIQGGVAPFTYQVSFDDENMKAINGESNDQWIKEEFSIPSNVGEAKQLKATVDITDAKGSESTSSKTFVFSQPSD